LGHVPIIAKTPRIPPIERMKREKNEKKMKKVTQKVVLFKTSFYL